MLTVLQRAELVTRMAVEIERYIVELGTEGRLIEMQLDETMVGVAADKAALLHDYLVEDTDECFSVVVDQLVRLPHQDLLDFGRLAELGSPPRCPQSTSSAWSGSARSQPVRPWANRPIRCKASFPRFLHP